MKITKTTWIILIVGVFLIMGSSVGWIYNQQTEQHKNIDAEIVSARESLAGISFDDLDRQKAAITGKIENLETDLIEIQKDMYTPLDSIQITNILLEEAEMYDIVIKEISSSGESANMLAGIPFNTLNISIDVEGTMKDIKLYVERLNELFPTSTAEYVQMDRIEIEETEEEEESETITEELEVVTLMTGNISLVIYSYEGE